MFASLTLQVSVFIFAVSCVDETKSPNFELADIHNCCELNMSAIQSADVLLIRESVLDSTKHNTDGLEGAFVSQKSQIRVKFDFSKSRLVFVDLSKIESLDLAEGHVVNDGNGVSLTATWSNGFEQLSRFQNGKLTRVKNGMFGHGHKMLKNIAFPDPRSLPSKGRLTPFQARDLSNPIVPSVLTSGKGLKTAVRLGDRVKLVRESVLDDEMGRMISWELQYDVKNSMPVLLKFEQFVKKDPKVRGLLMRASFEWKNLNGIDVPIFVQRTEPSKFKVNNRILPGNVDTNIRLHWFSINKPVLTDDFFESLENADDKFIQALVDPQSSRATTLLNSNIPSD